MIFFSWHWRSLFGIALFFLMSCTQENAELAEYHGAVADGKQDNTLALQKAIDAAHAQGGGTVSLTKGTYLSGALVLKSNVRLEIGPHATLKALPDTAAFPLHQITIPSRADRVPWRMFIRAEGQENIILTGGGKIDGSGDAPVFQNSTAESPNRPYGLLFADCQNITVENLQMHSSAHWMQRYFHCTGVRISGLRVFNHANLNNDGLDIDSSEDVVVSNCQIDASDDAIVVKSEGNRPSRNIVVSNCILSTHASAVKLGTGSVGGFENILFNNIVIRPSKAVEIHHPLRLAGGLTGIDLAAVDGGYMRNILISNVVMEGLENALHIRLGNRASQSVHASDEANQAASQQAARISEIDGITISNVRARNMGAYPVVIAGFEGHPVRNVTLRDVHIRMAKGGTAEDVSKPVNWEPHWYPFIYMYNSRMPAYGIVTNYTEGLALENFTVVPAPEEERGAAVHLNRK